jgi:hypothetical protein
MPGLYGVSETGLPEGWRLTESTCSDGSDPSLIELAPGELVVCSFTNTQDGRIIVEKETLPDGSLQSFEFDSSWGLGFSLGDGQSNDSGFLVPGAYNVSEINLADGWHLASAVCSDGSLPGAIGLDPGEVVVCKFTNIQDGNIIVEKHVVSTNPESFAVLFDFVSDYSDGFALADGEQFYSGNLTPQRAYFVDELVPEGWDLTAATCSDGSLPAAIDLDPGETVVCTFENTERASVDVLKLTNGVVNTAYSWTFRLEGPDVSVTDSTDEFGVIDFDGALLLPATIYTVCELDLPAGWNSVWDINGVVQELYNPDATSEPPQDLGTRCVDLQMAPGESVRITADNQYPEGGQRTIGYWKNWSSCTGGNQVAVAAKNGGTDAGYFLLDDVLPQEIGLLTVDSCETGVQIIDKRDARGRKKASDAAYGLAAQLLAAKLNHAAGAGTCTAIQDAMVDAQLLLEAVGFDGTGRYLPSQSKSPLRQQALELAMTLDDYNNGYYCGNYQVASFIIGDLETEPASAGCASVPATPFALLGGSILLLRRRKKA